MTHVIELALRVKVWWGLGLGNGYGVKGVNQKGYLGGH